MKKNFKVFKNIGELLTLKGADDKKGRRVQEADLSILQNAVLVAADGLVEWVGPAAEFQLAEWQKKGECRVEDLSGATVIPGFTDCHTHLVFAGDRSHEFEWRMQGQSYQEIAAKGGGILSTVRATRQKSEAELLALAQDRADRFLRQGVTLLEVKSGYGLDRDTEIRSLQVARSIRGPRIVTTYLGPHSRSPDFPDLPSYLAFILESVLPEVAEKKLADRADIYIEKGFFDCDLGRTYFKKCRALGLAVTAHVEQLSLFGGTDLALEFAPQSVDHVVYVNEATVQRLAQMETTAVLLPASDFYLKMKYPPARGLIDAGARVALSTDFNPGTSPTQDLSLVGVLARLEMKMSLPEVITAFTVGGAHALGKGATHGSLIPKKSCDFNVLKCGWQELFYSVGHHPVADVYIGGEKT